MSFFRIFDGNSWSLLENEKTLLTVCETEEDGKIVIALSGILRSDMQHVFMDELVALITLGKDILLDCKNLQYIANACQDSLLSVQQTADSLNRGTLTLRQVPEKIYADFRETNLNELLMIE